MSDLEEQPELKAALQEFVQRMQAAAGANLEAIVLYGSAAGERGVDQYSDVNLLCLLREMSGPVLDQVAPLLAWWTKELGQRPPLFMTAAELRASADVFAIEMLDMKSQHRRLYGSDVLARVEVPMNLHRVQVEHELWTLLLKLRQQYLLDPRAEQLETALAKSASSVVVLLRHALIAAGAAQVPTARRAVVDAAAEVFRVDADAVHAALDLREGRRAQADARTIYQRYMNTLGAITGRINEVAPR